MSLRLLTPARIGAARLKNRVLFPSMCNFYCDAEGFVTDQLLAYVRARAKGGAAAVILPGSPYGKPGPARPALSDPRYYDGWRALADVCHAEDCRLFVQIHPVKAQAGRDPSLLLPDGMPLEAIEEIVEGYARCARAAREIGLDGAEIHGAHAHEVAQFLSPYYNHRTDAYGGSVERRCLLAVRVIRAIKEAAGADFPLIFRLSSDERVPGGRGIGETVEVARILEAAGADALHVSTGMPLSERYISAPMDVPDGFNLGQIARVHEAVRIPVVAVDRINTPELAERVIAGGTADLVAVGRGMLADPDFVRKAAAGEAPRLCLGCNQGCRKSVTKKAIFCVQNPFTGREASLRLEKSDAVRGARVLVAGGGVAGLEAALCLALRGAQPEVWERAEEPGGLIRLAAVPPKKDAMRRLVDWRVRELSRLGVPLRLGREATPEAVGAFAPALLVAATGSVPARPAVPGLDDPRVVSADDALAAMRAGTWPRAGRVAVLGGGLAGLETADALAQRGASVELFELSDAVGAGLAKERLAFTLERLEQGGCRMRLGARVRAVRFPFVEYARGGEAQRSGPFDAVVSALGRRSERALADAVRERFPGVEVAVLGDAASPGTALEATAQAALFAASWRAR